MSGRIYSDRCPVHQNVLKTDRTKKFCVKKSGPIYDAPIYFCDKCKTYYVFIKELEVGFKGTAKASDGNPIIVLGTKSVAKPVKAVKKTVIAPKKTTTAVKQRPAETSKKQKKNGYIFRSINDGVLTVNIIPTGTKVPKSCSKCGMTTYNLVFKVLDINGKEKQLVGKECPSCGSIYYTESIVNQHPKCFRQAGTPHEQKKPEIKETAKATVGKKVKSKAVKPSSQKSAENQEQKKKKEIFSTFCLEHDIVLRTPVMWRPGIPLFSCPLCEKYYINSNLYPYGSVVGLFRARQVINADLMITRGPNSECKVNDNARGKIDSENRELQEDITDRKVVSSSKNPGIGSDEKAAWDDKRENLNAEKAEDQECDEQDSETTEDSKAVKETDAPQWQESEMGYVAGRNIYTDDFGMEFDFSELEAVLML